MTALDAGARQALLRRGFALEYATLGWNVVGIMVLAVAVISARSVALAGFGPGGPRSRTRALTRVKLSVA